MLIQQNEKSTQVLNNLTGKGVSVQVLPLCETVMNQLNINKSDILGYDRYVNFRQNKGGEIAVYEHTLRPDDYKS